MKYIATSMIAALWMPLMLLFWWTVSGIFGRDDYIGNIFTHAFATSILHSIILSFSVASAVVVLGGIWAFFVYRSNEKIVIRSAMWLLFALFLIQPIILLSVFKTATWFQLMSAFWQSVCIGIVHLFPLSALAWFVIWQRLSTNVSDVLLGKVSLFSVWRFIVLPLLKIPVGMLFLFLFILTFIDQEVPSVLGYRTYAEELFAQMTLMDQKEGIALSAIPMLFLALCFIVVFHLFFRFRSESIEYSIKTVSSQKPRIVQARLALISLFIFAIWIIFNIYGNAESMMHISSLRENFSVLMQSFALAFMAGFIASVIAIVLHYSFKRHTLAISAVMLFYLLLPHSLVALAILHLYQWSGMHGNVNDGMLFVFGYVYTIVPIVFMILRALPISRKKDIFLKYFPVKINYRLRYITLACEGGVWLGIFLIAVVFALNELSVSVLLAPPGIETVIIRIYNLLHYGDHASVAFLSLMQLAMLSILFGFLVWMGSKAIK